MSSNNVLLVKIGERIRRARIEKEIKQESLANVVHLCKSEISRIENGKREVKILKLIEIASAIGTSVNFLVEE